MNVAQSGLWIYIVGIVYAWTIREGSEQQYTKNRYKQVELKPSKKPWNYNHNQPGNNGITPD